MTDRHIEVFFYGLFMDDNLLRSRGIGTLNPRPATVEGFGLRKDFARQMARLPGQYDNDSLLGRLTSLGIVRSSHSVGGGFTSRSPLMNVGLNGVRRVASTASETQAGGALHQLKVRWPALVIG